MKKLLVFAGLAAVLIALVLWSKANRGGDADEVEIAEVRNTLIRSSVLAPGVLGFEEQVELGSEVVAKVTAVHAEEGDSVTRGQLLISLDPENLQAQLEQAEAQVRIRQIAIDRQKLMVKNLQRRYGNQQSLFERNLVDEDTLENLGIELGMAEVDLRSLEESLKQARAARAQAADLLSKTRILSPMDGMVIMENVEVGETVIAGTTNLPGSTLMVVADTSKMLVGARVDEADIAMISTGQRADIFTAAFPDTPIGGTVDSIGTTAQSAGGGQQSLFFFVYIELDEQDEIPVRSGMSARAEIFTQSAEETLAVPIQAVRYDEEIGAENTGEQDQAYVMLFEDGKAVRRDVEIGISSDSDQEITAGLSEGDRVIAGPYRVLRTLDDGDPVIEQDSSDDDDTDDGLEPADFD